jgi:hypothetical protein
MEFSSYITGFTDGEGTFSVSFNFRAKLKTKIEVRPSFSISQHKRNKEILESIRDYFNCGWIRFSSPDHNYKYEVRGIDDLIKKIIPHFQKFPLQTSKKKDFLLFTEICEQVYQKHHLNFDYLRGIIEKAYRMNPSGKRKYTEQQLLRFMTR